MSVSEFRASSLIESSEILCREWSRHKISTVGSAQMDLRFSQLRVSRNLTVNRLSYGAKVSIDPWDRDEVLLIQMPIKGRASAVYSGREVCIDAARYGVIDVSRVERFTCDAEFDALILRVRVDRIRAYLEEVLDAPLGHELRFADDMTVDSSAWHSWAPFAGLLGGLIKETATEFSPKLLASIENTVVSALVFGQNHSFWDEVRRPCAPPAPRHVRKVEAYVFEHAGESLSTKLLAAHANVSVRALFNGFRTFRNMTPVEFVRGVRLDRAREDLLAGSDTVSVISKKWGFCHLGNFAVHYRKRFGESPVETLKFAGRRGVHA
jgi:AraC-like DNA-binding protein